MIITDDLIYEIHKEVFLLGWTQSYYSFVLTFWFSKYFNKVFLNKIFLNKKTVQFCSMRLSSYDSYFTI